MTVDNPLLPALLFMCGCVGKFCIPSDTKNSQQLQLTTIY